MQPDRYTGPLYTKNALLICKYNVPLILLSIGKTTSIYPKALYRFINKGGVQRGLSPHCTPPDINNQGKIRQKLIASSATTGYFASANTVLIASNVV